MFIIKNNYYLYIENTNDININKIKRNKKISIVYRNNKNIKGEDKFMSHLISHSMGIYD